MHSRRSIGEFGPGSGTIGELGVSWGSRTPPCSRDELRTGAASTFRGLALDRPNDAITWRAPPLDALGTIHYGTVCIWPTRKRCLPNGSLQRAPR
jgi:hypothetical protein